MQTTQQNAHDEIFDYQSGGLTCEWKRAEMADKAVLIVGLGGAGIQAMLAAKREILREIKAPEGAPYPDRIAFLAVDQDEGTLCHTRVDGVGVAEDERVSISFKGYPPRSETYIWDWLGQGVIPDVQYNGSSGMIRQIGRFQLFCHAQELIDKIEHIADRFSRACGENGEPLISAGREEPCVVYLLAGLGGGTGSGIFLDVACLIRTVLERRLNAMAHMRAMLILPSDEAGSMDPKQRDQIFANTYAALRELDYWMTPSGDAHFRQRYAPDFEVDVQGAPLEWCALLTMDGIPLRKAFLRMVGRTLLHLVTAGERDDRSEMYRGIGSMNLGDHLWCDLISTRRQREQRHPTLGNCAYASFNLAERRLPLDEATRLIARRMLERVREPHDSALSADELKAFFRNNFSIAAILKRLTDAIDARAFGYPVRSIEDFRRAIAGMKRSQVLSMPGGLNGEMQKWLEQCAAGCRAIVDELTDSCIRELQSWLEEMFTDPDRGPECALKAAASNGADGKFLLELLESEQKICGSARLALSEQRAEHFGAEAPRSPQNSVSLRLSPEKFMGYADAVFKHYCSLRNLEFSEMLQSLYSNIIAWLRNWHDSKSELLQSALRYCDWAVDASWDDDDCDPEAVQRLADRMLSARFGSLSELAREFLLSILRESDAWLRGGAACREELSRLIDEPLLARIPAEEWFRLAWGAKDDSELKQSLQNEILPELQAESKPLFPLDEHVLPQEQRAEVFAELAYPGVPRYAERFYDAVREYSNQQGVPYSIPNTGTVDSLYWLQVWDSMPLRAHKLLPLYREAHKACGAADQYRGRYLRMSEEENWAEELPGLL